jgi:hypothetical protein
VLDPLRSSWLNDGSGASQRGVRIGPRQRFNE